MMLSLNVFGLQTIHSEKVSDFTKGEGFDDSATEFVKE